MFSKMKESHCGEQIRKRGREEGVGKAGELQEVGGEGVVDEGSWKEQGKFDEEADRCKEVRQADSTPSLSPETIDNSDKEGQERDGDEDSEEEDGLRKDIVTKGELAGEMTASGELCVNEGDDVGSSSEDSVKEEEEPKKMVRSRSRSVGGEFGQDQEQFRLPADDLAKVKVAESRDFKRVEGEEDSVQEQDLGSIKDGSAMREELTAEKLERKELRTSSSESSEEGKTMKTENHAGKDKSSDREKVKDKKRKKMKKQKKDRKSQAECEEKVKKAKKAKKAEKKAKKEKKMKKKKRKCKDSTSSESDLDMELLESKKKKAKKAGKAPNDETSPENIV